MKKIQKKNLNYNLNYSGIFKKYKIILKNINLKNELYENEFLIKKKKIILIKHNNESKIILNKINIDNNKFNFIYLINKIYKSPFFFKTQVSYKKNFLNKYLLNYFYLLIFKKLYKNKFNIKFINGRILSLSKKKKYTYLFVWKNLCYENKSIN